MPHFMMKQWTQCLYIGDVRMCYVCFHWCSLKRGDSTQCMLNFHKKHYIYIEFLIMFSKYLLYCLICLQTNDCTSCWYSNFKRRQFFHRGKPKNRMQPCPPGHVYYHMWVRTLRTRRMFRELLFPEPRSWNSVSKLLIQYPVQCAAV